MPITIKSQREIELMREAGRILAIVHDELKSLISPGISTFVIDKEAYEIIRSYNCIPSFLNLDGFPASICICINDEVVHGIPSRKRILRDGDIVSIDIGVNYKGYHSDAAKTHGVGEITKEAQKLIEVTRQSFYEGVKHVKEGNYLYQISNAIEAYVLSFGYSAVRDLVGHGIGKKVHESPQIPNFTQKKRGVKLRAGMTIAVEPMINAGRYDVEFLDDDWTVVTRDGSLSAHYEHTLLVTETGYELLSVR